MKNSVIRHPENSYFVIRRDWQVKALKTGPRSRSDGVRVRGSDVGECAAEILSIIEYHVSNTYGNTILRGLINKSISKKRNITTVGDWRPYTVGYLQELLLNGRGTRTIAYALDLLDEKRFISRNVPDDITRSFPLPGRPVTWLRMEHKFINKWIEENIPKSWGKKIEQPDEIPLPEPPEELDLFTIPEPDKPLEETAEAKPDGPEDTDGAVEMLDSLSLDRMVTVICNFHRHIHAKTAKYVYDANRKNAVRARLKPPEKRSLGQCAQAIIGNLYSDYHQARHPENTTTIYDDIDLIFRNAKKFENHLRYAEVKGIDEITALNELQAFAKGEGSKYAKIIPRTPVNSPKQPRRPLKDLPDSLLRRYRDFAREIAPFFPSNMKAKDVLELCKTVESLATAGRGLDREDALLEALGPAMRTFGEPKREVEVEAEKFVSTFCKLQALNKTED